MMPEALSKIIDPLPHGIKIFLGGMLAIQALAIFSWLVMMVREINNKDSKEKQS
jgi:hypothetical protein